MTHASDGTTPMANVTNELMYEVIKQIQTDTGAILSARSELRAELAATRGHVVAMSSDIATIYARLGHVEDRLERVEKRLGLVDVELN
jgi:hypothetical protein